MPAFKIWNVNRSQKHSIFIKENEGIYQALISKASQKMRIEGTALVLESDGTIVDEDESLIFYEKEIFLLLSENEKWIPASTPSECSFVETYVVSDSGELLKEKDSANTPISSQSSNNSQSTNYEIMWKNFNIPFHKFPTDATEEAEQQIPLEILKTHDKAAQTWHERRWRIQTQVVHIIVDEMRRIKTKIPLSAFKIIANKLSERYPLLKDIDSDNEIIGDGCFTLTMKLMKRNNYLNRPCKRKSTTAGKVPGKKSKKIANLTSGCSNWDPELNEEILDQENAQNSLNVINETDENFHQNLENSYSIIRTAINNNEPLKDILNQWPILRESKNAFYWHFQNLTTVDLTMLGIKIHSKADTIIAFGKKNKLCHSDDNIEPGLAVLQIFSKYFKEDIGKFILHAEEKSLQEVLHSLKICSPCIIQIDKENHKEYKVVIEKDIFSSVDTFDAALEMTFAAFYIFNLEYPKTFCTTLEMIQRYFLKIHPDQGSRSKKQGATKKKVIGLMTKLF